MSDRLQKVMAHAGIGSRRQCEALIKAGRVSVNGVPAELGMSVDLALDRVTVDGKEIQGQEPRVHLALNKPVGVLSSRKSQGGMPTVLDLVKVPERVYPVGRLDADSRGLMLLTNDGALTYRLTHPKFEIEKEYKVLLDRPPAEDDLRVWRRGFMVPGLGRTGTASVEADPSAGPSWIRLVMHEGKNREIRKAAEALGYKVLDLMRVRIGGLRLGDLAEGEWRHLAPDEIDSLAAKGRASRGRGISSTVAGVGDV